MPRRPRAEGIYRLINIFNFTTARRVFRVSVTLLGQTPRDLGAEDDRDERHDRPEGRHRPARLRAVPAPRRSPRARVRGLAGGRAGSPLRRPPRGRGAARPRAPPQARGKNPLFHDHPEKENHQKERRITAGTRRPLLIKPPPAPSELVRIQDDSLPAYSDYLAFNERAEVFR